MQKVFKIKKSLTLPLALDTLLLLALFAILILGNSSSLEIGVLAVGLVPLIFVSLELIIREIRTDESGIKIKKVLRTKEFFWGDITHVGVVALHKKVYLVLTTTKGFYIVSNAYEDFSGFIQDILSRVEREKIEDSVAGLIEHPVQRISDIVLSWVAVVVIAGIIFIKLFG